MQACSMQIQWPHRVDLYVCWPWCGQKEALEPVDTNESQKTPWRQKDSKCFHGKESKYSLSGKQKLDWWSFETDKRVTSKRIYNILPIVLFSSQLKNNDLLPNIVAWISVLKDISEGLSGKLSSRQAPYVDGSCEFHSSFSSLVQCVTWKTDQPWQEGTNIIISKALTMGNNLLNWGQFVCLVTLLLFTVSYLPHPHCELDSFVTNCR